MARGGHIISLEDDPDLRWWGDIILEARVLRDMRVALPPSDRAYTQLLLEVCVCEASARMV